jgi:hypothetical protein
MAVDGTYKVEIDTPIGKQRATIALKTDGAKLSGTADTSMGKKDFTGVVNGNDICLNIEISSPLGRMKLEFTGCISGNDICGEAKAGTMGCFPFKGKKI